MKLVHALKYTQPITVAVFTETDVAFRHRVTARKITARKRLGRQFLNISPLQAARQHIHIDSQLHQVRKLRRQCQCTHTHLFNGPLSGTTRVSRYQKGKSLKVVCVCVVQQYKQVHTQMYTSHNKCIYLNSGSSSGISWALCKSAPCSREITTLAPHHSVFYRPDALPAAIPTASKH